MDELSCAVGKLLNDECLKVITKISHLKMLDKEDIIEKCLPDKIYFNEIANEVVLK